MRELRRNMMDFFDQDELQTLVFDLGVDWDELSGEKKSAKSHSLISYLARRGRLEDLIELLREERPNENWPSIPDSDQQRLDEKTINPNYLKLDQELFSKVREILPSDGAIRFVRFHDYGGSFDREKHKDFHDFIWHLEQPEFEFLDEELEHIRKRLADHIVNFMQIIGRETFPISGSNRN